MKIVIVNHSDVRGGASVVSHRLMKALQAEGADVKMLVCHKGGTDPGVVTAAPHWRCRIPFLAEHLDIFARNGHKRSTLFKVSTARYGLPLDRHPLVMEADAVLLNWVNQGMLSLKSIQRMSDAGKRIVWTMHDMWNFTGICHHAERCNGYLKECGHCHYGSNAGKDAHDFSHAVWREKRDFYSHSRISFVAVSNWLAGLARRSSLLGDADISVIPNAFPIEDYAAPPRYSRRDLALPDDKPLVVMGAARLDDPIKDLPAAIQSLNVLAEHGVNAHAVFYGNNRSPELFESLRLPYTWTGPIGDPERVRSLMHHASAVLSSSVYETLPGTLIEGQAAGAVPVSFGNSGQTDIIDHLSTGYMARYGDVRDLGEGLVWALTKPHDRDFLTDTVRRRFSARTVAGRYLELIGS
ncbi:MAG: glycosyltransferase [Muribaculaceae bacterium]|nr:glycosyltransferase [Muribaculaceae bacterium]